jgi:hypothetical protein
MTPKTAQNVCKISHILRCAYPVISALETTA